MSSSLGYAILALLAEKRQSGYDISRQMKPPLGYIWQAKHGQIYPELARLVQQGLVTFERKDARAGPPRRVHSITAAGRAELAKWVIKPPQARPMNDELVIKAYALRRGRAAAAASLLESQTILHENKLAALEQLAGALRSRETEGPAADSRRFGEFAALRRAIGMERDYISWCRWLLEEMGSKKARASGGRIKRTGLARAG